MGCLVRIAKFYIYGGILSITIIFATSIAQMMPIFFIGYIGYLAYKEYGRPIISQQRLRRQCKADGDTVLRWNFKENKNETVPAPEYIGGEDAYKQDEYIEHARSNFNKWTMALLKFCIFCLVACIFGIVFCKYDLYKTQKDIYPNKPYSQAGAELMEKRREAYIALDEKTHIASLDEKISVFFLKGRKKTGWKPLYYMMNTNLGERAALRLQTIRHEALINRGAADEIVTKFSRKRNWLERFLEIQYEYYD